jgi:hypothetical protein
MFSKVRGGLDRDRNFMKNPKYELNPVSAHNFLEIVW